MRSQVIIAITACLPLAALGQFTWFGDAAGQKGTTFGYQAGMAATGEFNTFAGSRAGEATTTGKRNSMLGYKSGLANTTGNYNTYLGTSAGQSAVSAAYNVMIGYSAGYGNTAGNNTFAGYQAGFLDTTGNNNCFMGYMAFYKNNASNNTGIGIRSGYENKSGAGDVFVGNYSGQKNTTGSSNVFLGSQAGYNNTTGGLNTYIGNQSGPAFGSTAGTSSKNTFVGYRAGYKHTSGDNNTFLGAYAGYGNTTGSGNVFIGYKTGYSDNGSNKFLVGNNGNTLMSGNFTTGKMTFNTVTCNGGGDLAEKFDVAGEALPGMVVVIDPLREGKLKIAGLPYDRKVAGIISGAQNLSPGMVMRQKGSVVDGDYDVALSGKVYCRATAANGAIRPGDWLTSSDKPGYGMKATDEARAEGAYIGKALSRLDRGEGMVLVLVGD